MSGWFVILIIFVVLRALGQSEQNKKKAAQKQAQQQAEAAQAMEGAPSPTAAPRARVVEDDRFPTVTPQAPAMEDDRFPSILPQARPAAPKQRVQPAAMEPRQHQSMQPPPSGSLVYASLEGDGPRGSLQGTPDAYAFAQATRPLPAHVVKPLTESGHSHTESSMTGGMDAACTPDAVSAAQDVAYDLPSSATAVRYPAFDHASVIQGILYSEILGKPKALRRRA